MILPILNYLHHQGFHRTLTRISQLAYFLKGHGYVRSCFHPAFRAYEYRVNGIVYLSPGPGWAFSFEYLSSLLKETFNYGYTPGIGDCVVDIGAGLGEETVIYALQVGNKGVVHALEANPTTFAGLAYMCQQNKFTWTIPHNIAIYNEDSEVTIEDDEHNYLTNTINSTHPTRSAIRVKAKTLDSLVKECELTRIDFLKSNIEGAEQYLIGGMNDSIKIVRNVCISCHDFRHKFHRHGEFYVTKEKVKAFLINNGFEVSTRNTGNSVIDDYVYATNPNIH